MLKNSPTDIGEESASTSPAKLVSSSSLRRKKSSSLVLCVREVVVASFGGFVEEGRVVVVGFIVVTGTEVTKVLLSDSDILSNDLSKSRNSSSISSWSSKSPARRRRVCLPKIAVKSGGLTTGIFIHKSFHVLPGNKKTLYQI